MHRTFNGENLGAFYRSKRLTVDDFSCRHQASCLSCVPEGMRHGAEAYVGARYGDPFRIVLVSADLGDDVRRTSDSSRIAANVRDPEQCRHMKGTLEILSAVLGMAPSSPESFDHCALTNSAKCARAGRNDEVPGKCFRLCREYVEPELTALGADLVIGQGARARQALEPIEVPAPSTFVDLVRTRIQDVPVELGPSRGVPPEKFVRTILLGNRSVLWLQLPHPSDRHGRWSGMRKHGLISVLGELTRDLVSRREIPS